MLAYLSGPITGIDNYEQAFDEKADLLLSAGWQVINPCHAFLGQEQISQERFLRFHLHSILQADCLVMLEGWENSRGATFEKHVADMIGLPVYLAEREADGQGVRLARVP